MPALRRGWRLIVLAAILISSCLAWLPAPPAHALSLVTATQVAAGGRTTCAILTGGNGYCWGDNTYGQLGNGTTTNSATPVLISGGYTWASLSTQVDTYPGDNVAITCGVTTTGTGYCWGNNVAGEVGDGTFTPRATPTLVSGGYTWRSITVGWADVCGVTTSNAGYCWGSNWAGEGGNGTISQNTTPTLVSGGYSWKSIAAGWSNSCGVTITGTGYCWGFNNSNQVGDGTTTQHTTPTLISGGLTWSVVVTDGGDSCGITTSSLAYCWGTNWAGEVGDGTYTQRTTPTAVSGGYLWSQISEGDGTTCGVTTAGAGYCWGNNNAGEVGDGTNAYRTVPTPLSGSRLYTAISAGNDNTDNTECGLDLTGIIYCWGYNNLSQIGDGTTTNRNVPTEASTLFTLTASVTLSATMLPYFTFTVANNSSACNGESNFVAGAGSASAVAFGNLAAGANVSGGQVLSVMGNAGGGFAIYVAGNQASQNLRSGSHNWTDVAGTYASPAVLGAGERFGYTYKDSTASSSVVNPASTKFISLTNIPQAVMGSTVSTTGSSCVSFDAQASASTPPASYTATVIYTAVPTF